MREIKALVIAWLVAVLFANTIQPLSLGGESNKAGKAENFDLIYDNKTYIFSYPLDGRMMRNVTVKNTGTEYLELKGYINISGPGWTTPEFWLPFPQPCRLDLQPGEQNTIWTKIEWGESNLYKYLEENPIGEYNYTIQVNVSSNGITKSATMINTVRNYDFFNLHNLIKNAYVCGYVYDSLTN
ncbi:MAG: hypothetical protein AB1779_02060 [Candidatus Thermoplasmatota archaeon]